MKKIYRRIAQVNLDSGTAFDSEEDKDIFGGQVTDCVQRLQNDGLQVEIQYCPCALGDSQICLNALILGYTMEDDQ